MADDGSASNPRDPVKSSGWNVAVQRRRQQAFTVSKKIRKFLILAKRLRKVGTNGDDEDARVENDVMINEEQPILEAPTNIAVEELKSVVQYDHLPKELDRKTINSSKDDEIEMTSSMASSSSRSWRYDVFPSFSGEVRKSFLSHLLKGLDRRSINTFIDHGIKRSRPIGPELLLAIKDSRIAIVVFSKKYASSTWCLDELVEIHKCYKEFDQMVIPIFYNVDPSEVRKQTGKFGKVFKDKCEGKPEDQKQRWMQALADVANMAGEDLRNWPDEAAMIENIANDVLNKIITPSDDFGDFLGIEAHLEAMNSKLCLESKEAIMFGILGPSGIGKTTIGRALYGHLSSQFKYCAFESYKRTNGNAYGTKLYWEQQFLSKILDQKDLKIEVLGAVKQRLEHKKVLIVLDDVDDIELLKTLVGQTGWFGPGSRIIVITQDRQLLESHNIDLIYEVAFPSNALALEMLCRSAFGQNSPPDGFMELAVEVAKLAGNLPLGLSVLGSSLRGMDKDKWKEMLPRLRNDLDGNIEKTLRVSYDRLDRKEQELFLYIAHADFFRRRNLREFFGDSVNIGLKRLADKSLIRRNWDVEMHCLLQRLGREIGRADSTDSPGKRRFLVDVEDIRDVLTDITGTETVLGIYLEMSDINEPFFIDENSFKGMLNLQSLIVSGSYFDLWSSAYGSLQSLKLYVPQGLAYLPRKLRLLEWYEYPSNCLPCNFKAEFLVELTMECSKLEKVWEGTQPLRNLKRMDLSSSRHLKEIPDLSNAINLEELYLQYCESLVTVPSSIQNAIKLRKLYMGNCTKLESLPTLLNLKSLERLDLKGCFRLRNFPQVYCRYNRTPSQHGNEIEVEDCLWNKNLHGVDFLDCFRKCVPRQFRTEHIDDLTVRDSMIEKLWEGVQSLKSLQMMDLSECENLKQLPDLSKATDLWSLKLNNCKSLVTFPSTTGNLSNLKWLYMEGCTRLEVLPTDINLSSLEILDLSGCKRLRSFPQISWSIKDLNLNDTAIEEVPCCVENFSRLTKLSMRGCRRLKNISPNIFRLTGLKMADFSECVEVVTALGDASVVETTEDHFPDLFSAENDGFKFTNCINLDGDARELILRSLLILRSFWRPTVLPGGRVPKYFTHRSSTNSLTVTLPQSSLSQDFLGLIACVVLEPITNPKDHAPNLEIQWHFRGTVGGDILKLDMIYNTDHLVLVPLNVNPYESDYSDAEFECSNDDYEPSLYMEFNVDPYESDYSDAEFECSNVDYEPSPFQRIKGCGIRVLDTSPSPDGSDGSKKPML